jgi:hypothetical protein
MSKYQVTFIRKEGKMYIFESRKKKLYIEDMIVKNGRYTAKLINNSGTYGWSLGGAFISLTQVENACGECLTSNEWFIEQMKSDPKQWGRSATKGSINLTQGCLKIIDKTGEDYRIRYFEDKRIKNQLINLFWADIKNLSGYGLELSYR